MKKAIFIIAISCFSFSANAECRITSTGDERINAAFNKYGGWNISNFQKICAKLNRARARIQIDAASTVLVNQSIAWASVNVIDFDTSIGAHGSGSMNTTVNTHASKDKADELMVAAINTAVENWDNIDNALASLDEERKTVRAIYGNRKRP